MADVWDRQVRKPGSSVTGTSTPVAATLRQAGSTSLIAALSRGAGVAAVAALAVAAAQSTRPAWLAALAGSALLLALERPARRWPADLWIGLQLLIAAALGEPGSLILAALLLSLTHWDLDDFNRRVAAAPAHFRHRQLIRRHLLQLASALAVGGVLAGIALSDTVRLSFAGAVALAIVVLFGLSRLAGPD